MSFHFPGNCIFVWGTSRRLSLARLDWETALPGRFHHSELVWCADVPRCCISALSDLAMKSQPRAPVASSNARRGWYCSQRFALLPVPDAMASAGLLAHPWASQMCGLGDGLVSWAGMGSFARKGPGSCHLALQGTAWSPGCPVRQGLSRAPNSSLWNGTYWRFAKPRAAYGVGRDGSLAVSLSTSGAPNTQEPDSKQVKRGNFWTWWIADMWHPLPKGAVDTGRL